MNYTEYLKSEGATEEEIKIIDTPRARTAFDKLQAKAEADAARADAAEQAKTQYDEWYQDKAVPEYQRMERELLVSKANEAKARAAIKAAQDQGLADVAKDLGYEVEDKKESKPDASGFDSSKYFTKDDVVAIAQKEGEAIALAQDIAYEHHILFPDKPLNFRELRREAVAARKPVEQVWMEKYKVADAREAATKARHESEVAKWKAEGAKEKETELVSKFGNPDTRPLSPSTSPFAARPAVGRDKQPWEIGSEEQLSTDRVKRASQKVITGMTQ